MIENSIYRDFDKKIIEKDYNVPVYHYLPYAYLLQMLTKKKLVLKQTIKWQDVYENFLFKIALKIDDKIFSLDGPIKAIYGQCWSLTRETDALWRIYSPNKKSVRIKTTIRKLHDLIKTTYTRDEEFIGQVRYFSKSELYKWIKELRDKEVLIKFNDIIDSLFIKRKEFEHEAEVRIIVHKAITVADFNNENYDQFLKIKIDPNDLIEEITFDPRIDKEEYNTYRKIISRLNYKNKISRSKLYEINPKIIK